MKIKIESDVFDIVDRIKEIDDGYFIIYDTQKNKFEIHNKNQPNTYCFISKYDDLCNGVIDEIITSSVYNIDNIIEEIDRNNNKLENDNQNKMNDISNYKLREIYNFYNNSSKQYSSDVAFSTIWR